MDFIAEFGFDVKKGQAQDFQRWLSENGSKIPAACPQGVEYIGTYAVVQTSEKHAGGYRQLFRMESYGSQDTMAAAMKEGGAFASLIEEMTKFIDQDRDADWSSGLYKAVTDTSIWGDAQARFVGQLDEALPTYRLHDHDGDDLGFLEHPAPNVEPGDVVMLADGRETIVTARVEGGRGSRFVALLEVVVARETS